MIFIYYFSDCNDFYVLIFLSDLYCTVQVWHHRDYLYFIYVA